MRFARPLSLTDLSTLGLSLGDRRVRRQQEEDIADFDGKMIAVSLSPLLSFLRHTSPSEALSRSRPLAPTAPRSRREGAVQSRTAGHVRRPSLPFSFLPARPAESVPNPPSPLLSSLRLPRTLQDEITTLRLTNHSLTTRLSTLSAQPKPSAPTSLPSALEKQHFETISALRAENLTLKVHIEDLTEQLADVHVVGRTVWEASGDLNGSGGANGKGSGGPGGGAGGAGGGAEEVPKSRPNSLTALGAGGRRGSASAMGGGAGGGSGSAYRGTAMMGGGVMGVY